MTNTGISKTKLVALANRMLELGIEESDLKESFVRGSGPGGQKINKTSICVQLVHLPTKIQVKCQETRSQALNRYYAKLALCDEIATQILNEKSKKRQASEKLRRQKRKRSKRAKEKLLDDKNKISKKKEARKKPQIE